MSEATSRTAYVDSDDTAMMLLRTIERDKGLTNLKVDFRRPFTHRQGWPFDGHGHVVLLARICEALKVNRHIRELDITGMDNVAAIDGILMSNKTITKIAIDSRPDANDCLDTVRALLKRGPRIELSFVISHLDTSRFALAIQENSTLVSLSLSGHQTWTQGIKDICVAVLRCSALTKLDICFHPISYDDAMTIAEMLEANSTLTELCLGSNRLGKGAWLICNALLKNAVLKNLDLSKNDINDSLSGLYISKVIRENSTLTELCLLGNDIFHLDIFPALQQNTTLTKFEFESFRADDSGRASTSLADAMRYNSTLVDVSLFMISCDDEYSQALTRALRGNQTLRYLDISVMTLDSEGIESLGNVLKDNRSLVSLTLSANCGDWQPCQIFGEGLKANCTLKTLSVVDHKNHIGMSCILPTAIGDALVTNTGLENLTIATNGLSTTCVEQISLGLEKNATMRRLDLTFYPLDTAMGTILARGLISSSLTSLRLKCSDSGQCQLLADTLVSNKSLVEVDVCLHMVYDKKMITEFVNALKVNTSLRRLVLHSDLKREPQMKVALMEAYRENAALRCDILCSYPRMSLCNSWFYYRLNQAGRLLWTDCMFPATLWSLVLALADLWSSPKCPDVLFHFILLRPDVFRNHCCKRNHKKVKLFHCVLRPSSERSNNFQ